MAQQQIPWWWQFFQGQPQTQPQSDPNFRTHLGPEAGGGSFRSIGATSPTQTSPKAQGPPAQPFDYQDPNIEPTPLPQTAPNYPLTYPASDYPTQYAQGLSIPPIQGGQETLGTFYNPTPNETSFLPSADTYIPENPAPNENLTQTPVDQYLYNTPPDENVSAPQNQSYYGGGFNPEPNEGMTANPVDQYLYNVPPDENMIPNNPSTYYGGGVNVAPIENMQWTPADQYQPPGLPNPAPNEEMIPTPIGPPSDTNQYFPAGDGGHYVYDENFQPQGYQAPPDQPENIPTPPGATPDVLPAEPVPPPFTREGSGMMGTWQDYANTFTNAPYQSPFDTVPTSGLYGGNPTPLAGSFTGLGGFDPGSLEGTPWSGVSAEGLTATLPWGGSVLFHSAPGYANNSAPGSGQENLGFGSGHVSQLSVR